jgi:fructose-bisphosphate aldolase class II
MLINLKAMLRYAQEKKIAIGSFNIYNVESLQAVLAASKPTDHPVIISFGEAYDSHMPLEAMAELVRFYCATSDQPVVLHLDHSKKERTICRAIKAGFTSVMYDGSRKTLAENSACSREIATMAHYTDVSVEGELGYMNDEDGTGGSGQPSSRQYTRPEAAAAYAEASGVDALAIAIGNAHGIYKGTPVLDFVRLQEIAAATALPLVLHGSSGIPKEALQQSIRLGIRKININTEVSTRGIQSSREFLQQHTDKNTRFEALAKTAEHAMAQVVESYLEWFDLH